MDWTKEAIEGRKRYIGGSDAAAILGLSRYKTPLEVWAIKTSQIQPKDITDKVCIKLGNKLEATVGEFFVEETGLKIRRVEKTIVHPKYEFLCANVDFELEDEDAGLECKTTGQYKASEWEDEDIPIEYIFQCYHYLLVTGKKRWYIAVLIGNQIFKWKIIERDEKLLGDLLKREVAFWNNHIVPVVNGGTPHDYMPMQMKEGDQSVLGQLYPVASPESIMEMDDEAQQKAEHLDAMKADYKVLEKEIDELENWFRGKLGTHETGLMQKYKVTWKNQKDNRLDTNKLKMEEPAVYERFLNKGEKRVFRLSVRKVI